MCHENGLHFIMKAVNPNPNMRLKQKYISVVARMVLKYRKNISVLLCRLENFYFQVLKKNNNSHKSYVHFSYESPTALIQRFRLRYFFSRLEIKTDRIRKIESKSVVKKTLTIDLKFSTSHLSFKEKNRLLLEIFKPDAILARGILDTFRLKASPNDVINNSMLSEGFVENIRKSLELADSVKSFDFLILSDPSYVFNSALVSRAGKEGKKVFAFSPEIPFNEIRASNTFVTVDVFCGELLQIVQSWQEHEALNQFLQSNLEFFVNGQYPLDRQTKYSYLRPTREIREKKVLFLHGLRDASQTLPNLQKIDTEPLDYIEWMENCLLEIKDMQADWVIKVHSASYLYQDEIKILKMLFAKYGIRDSIVDYSSNPLSFLGKQNQLFTHSGTIGFEAASFGEKVNCYAGRFDSSFANTYESFDDYKQALRSPFKESYANLDAAIRMASALQLFIMRSRFRAKFRELYPVRYEWPLISAGIGEFAREVYGSFDFARMKWNQSRSSWRLFELHPGVVNQNLPFDLVKYKSYLSEVVLS